MVYLLAVLLCLPFGCYFKAVEESTEIVSTLTPVSKEAVQNPAEVSKKSSMVSSSSSKDSKNNNNAESKLKDDASATMNDGTDINDVASDSMAIPADPINSGKISDANPQKTSSRNGNIPVNVQDGTLNSGGEEYFQEEGEDETSEVSPSNKYGDADYTDRIIHNTMEKATESKANSFLLSNRKVPSECLNCADVRAKGKGIDDCPNCFTRVSGSHTDCHICKRIISHLKRLSSSKDYIERTTELIKEYCSRDKIRFKEECNLYIDDPEIFMYKVQRHINSGYVCANIGYCPRNNVNMALNDPGEISKIECEFCKKGFTSVQTTVDRPSFKSVFRDKVTDECWNIVTRPKIEVCRSLADSIVNYIKAMMDYSQPEGICVKAKLCPYSIFNEIWRNFWVDLRRVYKAFPPIFGG